jgi:hypothetical protein
MRKEIFCNYHRTRSFKGGGIMKKVIFFAFMICCLWIGTASSFIEPSNSGIVNDVSSDYIVINDHRYVVSPACKVFIQYTEDNIGHQKHGRISDIRRGDSIFFYKIANTVTELTIVR